MSNHYACSDLDRQWKDSVAFMFRLHGYGTQDLAQFAHITDTAPDIAVWNPHTGEGFVVECVATDGCGSVSIPAHRVARCNKLARAANLRDDLRYDLVPIAACRFGTGWDYTGIYVDLSGYVDCGIRVSRTGAVDVVRPGLRVDECVPRDTARLAVMPWDCTVDGVPMPEHVTRIFQSDDQAKTVCMHCNERMRAGEKYCIIRPQAGGTAADQHLHEACHAAYQAGLRRSQAIPGEAEAPASVRGSIHDGGCVQ